MDDHASYSAPSTPAPSTPAPSTNNELAPPLSTSPVPDSSFTYKMTEEDILQFVKLRVSNRALFTGKRHSARVAWRQILTEMGLQRKMTPLQARKKWDNLVSKYKMIHEQEQRSPRPGSGSNPQTDWPRYKFMDDAMQGRLDDSAKKLPITDAAAAYAAQLVPRKPRKRGWPPRPGSRASVATKKATTLSSVVGERASSGIKADHHPNEMELMLEDSGEMVWVTPTEGYRGMTTGANQTANQGQGEEEQDRLEIEHERALLDSERTLLEREREVLERERILLERERAGLHRELASLDRDRASLERDRATVERERAAVDWERAMLEKERARLDRDRLTMGIDAMTGRGLSSVVGGVSSIGVMNGRTNSVPPSPAATDGIRPAEADPECVERKQKFMDLLENLLQKF